MLDAYRDALADGVSRYPTIRGSDALRASCAAWLGRRFGVAVDAGTMVQPVTGTREALFAAAQVFCAAGAGQTVLIPNPFYQIYEGAALLAGAEPDYLNVDADHDFLPDLDAIAPERLDRARAAELPDAREALLEILGRDVGVGLVTALFFDLFEHAVELLADALALVRLDAGGLFHDHVRVHHDQPPVGVPHEARVAGLRDQLIASGLATGQIARDHVDLIACFGECLYQGLAETGVAPGYNRDSRRLCH